MKIAAVLYTCLTAFLSFGQSDTVKVIATLVSKGEGSKIHFATYRVIKVLDGEVAGNTLTAGYYFYNENKQETDTSLLTLLNYPGETELQNYFIFPEYNANRGIETVTLSNIDHEYWENCETGKECIPFKVNRSTSSEKCFLIMPCGGTYTTVKLSAGTSEIQEISIDYKNCPPVFDLRNLPDGKYTAHMFGCGLGGKIEVILKSDL